jgi:mannan endo-1,4-beta-mannosidase
MKRKDIKRWMLIGLMLCAQSGYSQKMALIDANATEQTKALFLNLAALAEKHTLFGHQHATEYGHGWYGKENQSDVKSVVGSHPAVIGVDLSGFSGPSRNEIQKNKEALRKNVVDTYNRGGVTTVSWHFNNPVAKGGFYWVDSLSLPAVRYIIPGGEAHQVYKDILSDVASWAHSLRGADGNLAPVIFRPYHEFDGDWFWWGRAHCTKEEFVSLWKFTVSYLRDSLQVHNFIYAFSPDNKFNSESEFLDRYPGDEWVDLVGMDNYGDMGRDRYAIDVAAKKLKIISDYAEKHGKLAAFTETGLESIPNPQWWTGTLLKTMQAHRMKLCYVLVWRNDVKSPTHFYAPFPGHTPSIPDFKKFYDDPYTLFEVDLKEIYTLKKKGTAN